MELNEYKLIVEKRYDTLSEEEKNGIRGLKGSAAGNALGKLLGEEMRNAVILGEQKPVAKKKRGLATR